MRILEQYWGEHLKVGVSELLKLFTHFIYICRLRYTLVYNWNSVLSIKKVSTKWGRGLRIAEKSKYLLHLKQKYVCKIDCIDIKFSETWGVLDASNTLYLFAGKILIFYTIFYAALISLFSICMVTFLQQFINPRVPRLQQEYSVIGTSPGLGFRPMPPDVRSTLIWYKGTGYESYKYWEDQLIDFLSGQFLIV